MKGLTCPLCGTKVKVEADEEDCGLMGPCIVGYSITCEKCFGRGVELRVEARTSKTAKKRWASIAEGRRHETS